MTNEQVLRHGTAYQKDAERNCCAGWEDFDGFRWVGLDCRPREAALPIMRLKTVVNVTAASGDKFACLGVNRSKQIHGLLRKLHCG